MRKINFIFVLFLMFVLSNCKTKQEQDIQQQERLPNILWITNEDMSPKLSCYGDTIAKTPHIDQLALEGVRYTNVYSVSGVCSPSRSALITGCYPTTIGTLHHRTTTKDNPYCDPYVAVPPDDVKGFPEFLRKNGYYCTNNAKTDYQFGVPFTIWDESSNDAHWRNRPDPDQPFFAVFNSGETHESRLFRDRKNQNPKVTDRNNVPVPPYFPDHPEVREDLATRYDNIHAMDSWVGDLLAQLEEDGLAENTIVFYFSDHGTGLPRGKRWMYDTGIKVPLIIRWPGNLEAGKVDESMISFIDFAPTVLSLAGIEPPNYIQGEPFLGEFKVEPDEYIFAARDRTDELLDQVRAVRDNRYKYILNLSPEIPYSYPLSYAENIKINQVMRQLDKEGKLTGEAAEWFSKTKPEEELYDTESDPYEVKNLAQLPEYKEKVNEMREILLQWQEYTNDLGLVPEEEIRENMWPEGDQPATINPAIELTEDNKITIGCATEGASIGYKMDDGPWMIYDKPIEAGNANKITAKAIRYGYKTSDEVELKLQK